MPRPKARTWLTRRGAFALGPTTLRSGDPFGLFVARKTVTAAETLVVLPMSVPVRTFPPPPGILPGGRAIRRKTMDVTPHASGVREYVPGDPMKRIHWPSTVRRGRFMVKEFEQDPQSDIWLFLDAHVEAHVGQPVHEELSFKVDQWLQKRPQVKLPCDTFEYAVSAAASLAQHFLKQQRAVGLACAAGRLTVEQAQELLELLWLKLFSIIKVRPWDHTRYGIGYPTYQNVTVGGVDADGQDATNDVSYMVLETIRNTRLTQPNVSARIHANTPERFLMECARTIRLGFGMPAIKNDEIIIPALLEKGVSPADAYNYAIVGCIEASVPGKWGYRVTGMSFLNVLKILELALNDGRDPRTGLQLHPGRGDLTAFDSFEALYQAFYEQYLFYIRTSFHLDAVADVCLEEMVPDAFCSALVDDCLRRGLTIKEGGAVYDIVSGLQSGVTNTANALMALKKLVFDDRVLTAARVQAALSANFENEGGEVVRQRLLRAPKYGNDLDEVDALAVRIMKDYQAEMTKYHHTRHGRGPIGGGYAGSTSNISANVPLGSKIGATPDGRKAGEPIAEGVSAMHGTDSSGPTGLLRSVSKLPTIKMVAQLLNIRLSPTALASEAGLRHLVALIKGLRNLKVWHVQFNTVDTETLLAAQRNPEQYRDLVVRVAGYSALFVTLDRATQDDIIRRTVHDL